MGPEQAADSSIWLAFRAIIALIVVLAAIMLVSYLLRKFSGGAMKFAGKGQGGIELDIISAKTIGSRRKLLLIRRDDVAHLMLIGGGSDVLIEQDIPIEPPQTASPKPKPRKDISHEERIIIAEHEKEKGESQNA